MQLWKQESMQFSQSSTGKSVRTVLLWKECQCIIGNQEHSHRYSSLCFINHALNVFYGALISFGLRCPDLGTDYFMCTIGEIFVLFFRILNNHNIIKSQFLFSVYEEHGQLFLTYFFLSSFPTFILIPKLNFVGFCWKLLRSAREMIQTLKTKTT